MTTFKLEIECDNESFVNNGRFGLRREIERIAGAVAARIEDGETEGTGKDINGNTCAHWTLDA